MTVWLLLAALPDAPPAVLPPPAVAVPVDGWVGIALPVDPLSPPDDAQRMIAWAMRQNEILSHLVVDCDVIPVAPGSVFSSPSAVQGHLARHAADLGRVHASIRGAAEYWLRIGIDAEPAPTAGTRADSGADWLALRRQARDRRRGIGDARRDFAARIAATARRAARRSETRQPAAPLRLLEATLLLPRETVPRLTAELGARADEAARLGLAMRLVGPAAPFSFTGDSARERVDA